MHPDRAFAPAANPKASAHPVEIHIPDALGVVDSELKDSLGRPVGVSCKTCHDSSRGLLLQNREAKDFHKDLTVIHGKLSCNSCHDQDRTRLHLADGRKLDFDQTMELCAQCHGPQHRDYERGAHGGMNGYWDRKRGPRQRNHCLDCHAAHTPAYEKVMPVHPPRDRYLDWKKPHE